MGRGSWPLLGLCLRQRAIKEEEMLKLRDGRGRETAPRAVRRRLSGVAAFAAALVVGAAAGGSALAGPSAGSRAEASPASQTVNVPSSASQTVTKTWTGMVPAGANPSSDCEGFDPLSDDEHITFTVPAAVGTTIDATFDFLIQWTPGPGGASAHDLILTVIGPDQDSDPSTVDGQNRGSSDGGSPTERVTVLNLPSGLYHVLACPFANASPQDYNGKLTVTTKSRTTQSSLSPASARGLAFSAAVPADQQRDEAEPLITIDKHGQAYTCGPTGFSNAADYAQVSWPGDYGDQFHLLGTPPRGQQGFGGGGDCGMATNFEENSLNAYQYAYSGLGPLTGFTTSTSPNNAHNLGSTPFNQDPVPGANFSFGDPTESGGLADRQWMVFIDPAKNPDACAAPGAAAAVPPFATGCVLLSYNQLDPRFTIVQRSANGGLLYGEDQRQAAMDTDFPGPLRYYQKGNYVYFPWSHTGPNGEPEVRLSVSHDGGLTWGNCLAAIAPGDIPPFVIADNDNQGNIYVVYSEKSRFHAYMVTLKTANVDKCNLPVASTAQINPGFSAPVQVDRGTVRTAVFPWIAAGGAPGRVAVSFYGTTTDGDPAVGCTGAGPSAGEFCGAWDVYVNQSLNALASSATFSQVKATTHPFHYDSICLEGLACDLSVPPGDRTLADFFSIAFNTRTDRLMVVFNRDEKKPNDAAGYVSNPMVFGQIAGPSNAGDSLTKDSSRVPLRTSSSDPSGDALSNYSLTNLGPPAVAAAVPPMQNEAAGDFTSVEVSPEFDLQTLAKVSNGGFTVTMKTRELTSTSIQNVLSHTGGQSMLWIWRFVNGYQAAAAVAAYNPALDLPGDGTPADGFDFYFVPYELGATPCQGAAPASGKCVVYANGALSQATAIPGRMFVPEVTPGPGIIRMSVPRSLLKALGSDDAFGRPQEVPATAGSPLYDGTAFSLVNTESATQDTQTFLYPLDNSPPFDFKVGSGKIPSSQPPANPLILLANQGPSTAAPSSTVTYTISYVNVGRRAAKSARITDTLPDELSFVSAAGGNSRVYKASSRTVTWNLGSVASGATGEVTLIATVSPSAPVGLPVIDAANFKAGNGPAPPTAIWTTVVVVAP